MIRIDKCFWDDATKMIGTTMQFIRHYLEKQFTSLLLCKNLAIDILLNSENFHNEMLALFNLKYLT